MYKITKVSIEIMKCIKPSFRIEMFSYCMFIFHDNIQCTDILLRVVYI